MSLSFLRLEVTIISDTSDAITAHLARVIGHISVVNRRAKSRPLHSFANCFQGIPTLIIAVAGIDDAASVAIYGIVKSVMFSQDALWYQILQGPIAIIGGLGFGIMWGWLAKYVPEKGDVSTQYPCRPPLAASERKRESASRMNLSGEEDCLSRGADVRADTLRTTSSTCNLAASVRELREPPLARNVLPRKAS